MIDAILIRLRTLGAVPSVCSHCAAALGLTPTWRANSARVMPVSLRASRMRFTSDIISAPPCAVILSIVKQNCFLFKNSFSISHVNVYILVFARGVRRKSHCVPQRKSRIASPNDGDDVEIVRRYVARGLHMQVALERERELRLGR